MARKAKLEYKLYADGSRQGAIALYHHPGSTRWYARLKLRDGSTLNQFATKTSDESKAVDICLDEIVLRSKGVMTTGKSFALIAKDWLTVIKTKAASAKDTKKRMADTRVKAYTAITERYLIPYFGAMPMSTITQETVDAYEVWRADYWKTGPGSQEDAIEHVVRKDGIEYDRPRKVRRGGKRDAEDTVLRQIFKFAIPKYMTTLPNVGPDREQKAERRAQEKNTRRPAFDKDQVKALLKYADDMCSDDIAEHENVKTDRKVFRAWLYLMLASGLRPGFEFRQLRWKDVSVRKIGDHDHLFLNVHEENKTGSRPVRCDPFARSVLIVFRNFITKYSDDNDYVFCDQETGKPIQKFDRQFHTMLRTLKIEGRYTPYSLRHTYITLKLNEGKSDRLIAMNTGTSTDMIRRFYGHDTSETRANEFISDVDWLAGNVDDDESASF